MLTKKLRNPLQYEIGSITLPKDLSCTIQEFYENDETLSGIGATVLIVLGEKDSTHITVPLEICASLILTPSEIELLKCEIGTKN